MVSDAQRFGFGLEVEDGDLVLENGALAQVSGKPNLLQALTLRVLTPYGTDRFNTAYGLDISRIFSHAETVRVVKELIKLNLVRTLSTDPRVRDIREIRFPGDEADDDVVQAEARAERRRRFWRVEVVIDTVDDQTVSLLAEIGA